MTVLSESRVVHSRSRACPLHVSFTLRGVKTPYKALQEIPRDIYGMLLTSHVQHITIVATHLCAACHKLRHKLRHKLLIRSCT